MSDQPKPTEQPKLEPCPFCGKPAICEDMSFGGQSFWDIGCPDKLCAGNCRFPTNHSELRIAAWNRRVKSQQLPDGISREDAIAGLREIVSDAESAERVKDPSFRRYPTVHTLLDFIENHGFPPPGIKE